jgi:hypothetical protein
MSRWQSGFDPRRNYNPENPLAGRAANDPFFTVNQPRMAAAQQQANFQRQQAAAAANMERMFAEQAAANEARSAQQDPYHAAATARMANLRAGTAASIATEGIPVANVQPRGRRHSNSNLPARQAAAVATAANAARRAPIDRLAAAEKPGVFGRLKSWLGFGGRRTVAHSSKNNSRRTVNRKKTRRSSKKITRRR